MKPSRSAQDRTWTLPLKDLNQKHLPEAGGKAVALGRLMQARFPVPPGFVITTSAFQTFIDSIPDGLLITEGHVDEVSRKIHEVFSRMEIPVAVTEAIQAALEEWPQVLLWAVRSSATAEDSPDASFAGQHESFLNVPREQILTNVRQCWLSLFSERALAYRLRNHIPHERAAMAVIVQRMVPAELAGVLFTADPSGRPNRIVIEGARGLGDQVVSGHVTPDRLMLSKVSFEILERGPNHEPRTSEAEAVLPDNMARRLAALSLKVEKHFGKPLDIEWAIHRGDIHLLQARPITTPIPETTWEDRQVWANLNTGEVFPDVVTPVTWSLWQRLLRPLGHSVFRLLGTNIEQISAIELVGGRIYFNINTVLGVIKPFPLLRKRILYATEAMAGGNAKLLGPVLENLTNEDLPDSGFRWHKFILSWPSIFCDLLRHRPRRADEWTATVTAQVSERINIDFDAMATSELVQFFKRMVRDDFEGWNLLYLGMQAIALPILEVACRKWLNDPKLTIGYRLFAGLGEIPEVEAGLALWNLASLAHGSPHTESILTSSINWNEVSKKLRDTEHGRQFLGAWNAFMSEHGHHCRGELELYNARWSETPDYILRIIQGDLHMIDQSNPVENQRRIADGRLELTRQCEARLKNPVKRWLFSRSLRRAQKLSVMREKWKNEAVRQITALRTVLQILGKRLRQQGKLGDCDDVFFLEIDELESVVNSLSAVDTQQRIDARRKEYEANKKLHPPPIVVGTFDPSVSAAEIVNANATVLEGLAVSAGVVKGLARVILRSDDHQQVLKGEILVAPFTDPAWTPYFVSAAGVVTDQGGILSHGSIVAREYGLPAVTNVGTAVRIIQTGDLLEVDGNHGRVTILKRADRDSVASADTPVDAAKPAAATAISHP